MIAWIKALRLPSQSYIFLPLLLGQALALHQGAELGVAAFALVHGFGLAIQFYIVLANDYADQETDRHNWTFTPFSGGSRVLVDGDLTPRQVGRGAILTAACSLVAAAVLNLLVGTVWPVVLAVSGVLLLWLYSYPPMRVSYSGGGEFLQMFGVGVILPLFGYAAQAHGLAGFPWAVLLVVLPTQLGCAIGTAIPDQPSDELDGKRTVPVLVGVRNAKVWVLVLHLLSLTALFAGPWSPHVPSTVFMTAGLSIAVQLVFLPASPGTKGMLAGTFCSILTTLCLMLGLTIAYWPS